PAPVDAGAAALLREQLLRVPQLALVLLLEPSQFGGGIGRTAGALAVALALTAVTRRGTARFRPVLAGLPSALPSRLLAAGLLPRRARRLRFGLRTPCGSLDARLEIAQPVAHLAGVGKLPRKRAAVVGALARGLTGQARHALEHAGRVALRLRERLGARIGRTVAQRLGRLLEPLPEASPRQLRRGFGQRLAGRRRAAGKLAHLTLEAGDALGDPALLAREAPALLVPPGGAIGELLGAGGKLPLRLGQRARLELDVA